MPAIPAHRSTFTPPFYSYLIEPGPMPSYIRGSPTGPEYVPFWTRSDLFEAYLKRVGLAGKSNLTRVTTRSLDELIAFLNAVPSHITHVMVDPDADALGEACVFPRSDIMKQLQGFLGGA